MYIPKLYREEDRETILSFLHQNPFATLVTFDGARPVATHTLVEVVESENGQLTAYSHISRANPQRTGLLSQEILLIFQGPHTYISPRWYNHVNVPTWNYMIVHLYGKAHQVEGEDLFALLSRLVEHNEGAAPYRLEALPSDFVADEMKGVFGFAVEITRLEAAYKLSQNRSDEDYGNIIHQLEQRGDQDSHRIARSMRAKRPGHPPTGDS